MKKVCILTTAHPRFDTRVFFREARSLAREYDTVLLVADGRPAEEKDGVRICPIIDREPKNRPERMFRFTRLMYRAAMAEGADVYHFHDTELFFVALKLRRHGKTVIYDAHESTPDMILERDYLPRWMLRVIANGMKLLERYIARRMNAVVTVTPFLKKRFDGWGREATLVCNYPVLSDFSEGNTPWSQREDAACYAGAQIDRSRGVYEMTEAVQTLGLPLHLYGRIPEVVGRDLTESDKNALITMHGRVEHRELRDRLCHTRYGLVTEYRSGNAMNAYCIKMFEYMAAGMAIVASDIPLWKEIVTGCGCGLCADPEKPDEIAERLMWLRTHPDEAERMGQLGRKAAEETYNWKTQETALLELYRKLTSEARS